MHTMNSEYVAFILWQREYKDEIIGQIKKYCSKINHLKVELIETIPIETKKEKSRFVRLVYPNEILPDDKLIQY